MNSVSAFMFLRIFLLLISSIIASFVAYWAKDKKKLSHGFPFFRNCKLWNGDFLFVIIMLVGIYIWHSFISCSQRTLSFYCLWSLD